MPTRQLSLLECAEKMAKTGPEKQEPANRRVRGMFDGRWLFDTTKAEFVWEHPYYPLFYIPLVDLMTGPAKVIKENQKEGFWLGLLLLGEKPIYFSCFETGSLEGLVKIPVDSLDAWFVEDERLLGPHPKDPYKRIECLGSSREVLIDVDGVVIAKSTNNMFLYETLLRPRYYLLPTSVLDYAMLVPSDTKTFCPYKGEASYYHLRVGERFIKDAIWYYSYPTSECTAIQNRICFYNEKVGVYIDGRKEEDAQKEDTEST